MNERRCVAKGVEASLMGQQLLVRHRVDGMREAERRTEQVQKRKELW